MPAVDPNRNFSYVVDDKGSIRELEVMNGKVQDSYTWELFADSQVSSGWMAAAYRCLKDDPCDDTVIVDPDPCDNFPSSLSLFGAPGPPALLTPSQRSHAAASRATHLCRVLANDPDRDHVGLTRHSRPETADLKA